jgi:hypothetical protein
LSATIRSKISNQNEYFFKPPNDTLPIRIFRIYKSKKDPKYGVLNGKKIKTIANTVYN